MFLLTGPNICRFIIVHGGSPGLKISKIENKVSLRVVQNCNIQLENVFVPDDDRLLGANCFQDLVDVRKLLRRRLMSSLEPTAGDRSQICAAVHFHACMVAGPVRGAHHGGLAQHRHCDGGL
jgi:hypothetical protein